jgi:hypothetical protein
MEELIYLIPEDIYKLLVHEYSLGMYGVMLWQFEQAFTVKQFTFRQAFKNIGRSLVWVGAIVVFDDELLSQYNKIANLDYQYTPWWMYLGAGFCVDIIRSRFAREKVKEEDKEDS